MEEILIPDFKGKKMKLYRACNCYSQYCEHNPADNNELRKGDIVISIKDGYPLRCGSGIYEDAVVVSTKPLVLLSRKSDMKWTQFYYPLRAVGKVNKLVLLKIIAKRYFNEKCT